MKSIFDRRFNLFAQCFVSQRLAWVVLMLGLALAPAQQVLADGALADFRKSVDELERWLATSPNGGGWGRYLQIDDLKAQAALGEEADIKVLRDLLSILERKEAGLDRWRFVSTRSALTAWLAELHLPPLEKLPGRVQEAMSEFRSINDKEREEAKQKLDDAIVEFETFMSRSIPSRARAWYEYLQWGRFKGLLLAEKPNLRSLNEILQLYYQDHKGLEMHQFLVVREALRDYMNLLLFSDYRTADAYEAEMKNLSDNLVDHISSPSSDTALAIGRAVGFLHRARQAPDIVDGVRYYYSRPNFYAHVSADMLNSMVARPVNQTSPVRENILGTSVTGTANTRGAIGLTLLPSYGSAVFRLDLKATTTSSNVGRNGPVTVRSQGVTDVNAHTIIRLDSNGISSGLASAECRTSSSIQGINTRFQIMSRIAQREVYERKAQADRIASQRAETRVANKMNSEVRPQVTQANSDFYHKIRYPLIRQDAWPDSLQFFSDPSRLYIVMMQANAAQISASDAPPEVIGEPDVSARVHETYVSNFSQALIGGEEMKDEQLAVLVKDWTGKVPEELQKTDESEPWSLTFDQYAPFRATFDGNLVHVGLRGRRFTRGDQTIRRGLEISATYRLDTEDTYLKLVRVGDVKVEYTRNQRVMTLPQIAFKTFMRKKFESLFIPTIRFDGSFQLPGSLRQLGPLQLTHFNTENGWLSLNWVKPSGTTVKAGS